MSTNGVACLIAVIYSVAIGEFSKAINFIMTHKEIGPQLVIMAILGTLGQLSIYYIVKHFQPYVTAIITTIRKVLTVLLSVVFFRHDLSMVQWLGIGVVFLGVAFETLDELKAKEHEK
jgi:UDP-galactose transporter B1